MLKTLHILLGLALLLATVGGDYSWSQSQRRPQTQNQTEKSQNKPAVDERGTEQSPLVVKILPILKSEADTGQETNDRNERMEIDRKLVKFNGDLACYTFILILVG